jgi:general secretion pathway protein G
MRLRQPRRLARPGFTLVEILIVVVIVIILASLLSAAALRAVSKSREVRNRHDISQLAGALETFKQKFGFYPPSRIKLCEIYSQYGTVPQDAQLDADSVQVITRMFPQCLPQWQNPGIDWDNSGGPSPVATLEGDQCLVFFLGGIQAQAQAAFRLPPNCLGFSTNPRDPAYKDPANVTASRIGPFYNFAPTRLVKGVVDGGVSVPIHPAAPFYHVYADVYSSTDGVGNLLTTVDELGRLADGAPYAYFSSYKTSNGYNRYASIYNNSDCATLQVGPYWITAGKYLNPDSFQIISAGKNHRFGPGGGPWSPAIASQMYPDGLMITPGGKGRDDQSNFSDTLLGYESN